MERKSRPSPLRRHEQQALTRHRLLDAAASVFAHKGFREASVAAIASKAGYSHGAVYSNFKDKDELFLVLVEERIDARLAMVYEAADAELSRGAEPVEAARRFVAMLQSERDAYLLLIDFWNQAVRDSRAARKFGQRHARLRTVIGRILEGATRDQGLRLTHRREQVATALIALFNGFTIERLADPAAAPDEILAHAAAAILKGFAKRRTRRGKRRTRKET